jgi:hypothetical protein
MAASEQQQEKKRTGSCLARTVGSLIDGGIFGRKAETAHGWFERARRKFAFPRLAELLARRTP